MKYYLKVSDNSIDTNLEYTNNNDNLVFNVKQDCDINMEIVSYAKKIILNIEDSLRVNLTSSINKEINEAKIDLEYNIASNCFVNEFILMEDDEFNINYTKNVNVAKFSEYEVSNAFFSDSSINMKVNINLDGEFARSIHNIAAISRLSNEKKFNVSINNNAIETIGELNNYGVVKDSATLIFTGYGKIKKGAKQAQAHQESKIITFDPKVNAQANPFLIIDEADVQASHAAAVGKMDEEQLYYIQSRGIDFKTATQLVTYGYLKPILSKINDETLKVKLENLIENKAV